MSRAHEEFQRSEAFERSVSEAKGITDPMLRRLTLMSEYWRMSAVSPRSERLAMAKDLDDGELSLNNISAVSRVSLPTLTRHFDKRARKGGRFSPESLSSLRYLRTQVIQGIRPSVAQIVSARDAGTSPAMIARLIGVSDWHVYTLCAEAEPRPKPAPEPRPGDGKARRHAKCLTCGETFASFQTFKGHRSEGVCQTEGLVQDEEGVWRASQGAVYQARYDRKAAA